MSNILLFLTIPFSMILSISIINVTQVEDDFIHLLLDMNTNTIVLDHHIDERVPVASLSKLMVEYILLEHVELGAVNWNDDVQISSHAILQEGVKIELIEGDFVSLKDLYMAMRLPSANNATVAIAEHISGSEESFTILMNEKAQELGLSSTQFVNATGLTDHEQSNTMSARDISTLASKLITKYPSVLESSSIPFYTLEYLDQEIETTNHMLTKNGLMFDGLDGLKTGYTDESGFSFVGTAQQNGQRYVTVVLGTPHYDSRFIETKKLLSDAFEEKYVPSIESIIVFLQEVKAKLWLN
ncbi:D-alanyl-D-alanine carboxypeptidase [Bacillus sp. TS-2]|nr:D-alanyl-D-alanine carboxypeptidase [Bacillus sp. TS-2]